MLTPNARAILRKFQHHGRKRFLVSLCVLCTLAAVLGIACWSQQEALIRPHARSLPTDAADIQKLVEELSFTCEGLDVAQQPYYHAKIKYYRSAPSQRATQSILVSPNAVISNYQKVLKRATHITESCPCRQQLIEVAPHQVSSAPGCALHSLLLHCPVIVFPVPSHPSPVLLSCRDVCSALMVLITLHVSPVSLQRLSSSVTL